MAILETKGYTTLTILLFISALAVVSAATTLLLGIGYSRLSFSLEQSYQAKALADACTEDALQTIRSTPSFTGGGGLTLGQGTCAYTVTSQGGENRTIESTGTVSTTIRKARTIITTINPQIIVSSWQEVADF